MNETNGTEDADMAASRFEALVTRALADGWPCLIWVQPDGGMVVADGDTFDAGQLDWRSRALLAESCSRVAKAINRHDNGLGAPMRAAKAVTTWNETR